MNAMPFGSDKNRAFREKLMARRGVLQREIATALQELGKDGGMNISEQVHDLKDESLAEMLTNMHLTDMHRDIQELRDIDAALLRLQSGSYGICMDCGDKIPLLRLEAYPTAKRCRPCQEAHEKSGDSSHRFIS